MVRPTTDSCVFCKLKYCLRLTCNKRRTQYITPGTIFNDATVMNIHTSKSWNEERMEHNLQQGIHISKEDANTECYLTQNNTGRHQFCL